VLLIVLVLDQRTIEWFVLPKNFAAGRELSEQSNEHFHDPNQTFLQQYSAECLSKRDPAGLWPPLSPKLRREIFPPSRKN
jgi:hypothetical protein